jgi:hypothetical protein
MKNLKVFALISIFLLTVTLTIKANSYRNGFNDYKIETVTSFDTEENVDKMWNLTYNGSDKPVTVIRRHVGKDIFYIVNSQHFEVCYACTSKGFGTNLMKKMWSCVPVQINAAVLNANEFSNQRIITPKKVNDEEALVLIADYLPNLINDQYIHVLQ